MAQITTYATLQANVATWLNRGDLTSDIPTMIQLAEAELATDVRVRKLVSTTLSITGDGISLPTDYGSMAGWYLDGPTFYGPIKVVGAEQLADITRQYGPTGVPAYAAIVAGTVRFGPPPDDTYASKMTYWRSFAPLSDVATSNWLLLAQPNIYLYATLVAASPYLKHDERIPIWEQRLEKALENLHKSEEAAAFSGTLTRSPRRGFGV